ncbi:unnamed protein product [Camellia sinensis]
MPSFLNLTLNPQNPKMENHSYSSYPDSGNSSPRSREIDCENASWDEPLSSNYKVKFMCSYGGKIHPRPHDNQLTYVGGDTKILAVDRSIKFSALISKLSALCDSQVSFKYQLPGEDLDALISVTNDEDLEHMMMEYDRLCRASAKPARLRLFMFPLNHPPATGFGTGETKSERQWFVDALNSVQIQPLDVSSPPSAANPDFLFGLEKGHAPLPTAAKVLDLPPPPPQMVPETHAVLEEDRHVIGEPVVTPADYQRQIQEFQRLQIGGHEQGMYQRKIDEANPRAYAGDYYAQKLPEKLPPPQPVTAPASYWQERHLTTGGYPVAAATGPEPPVYLIQTPSGVYQTPVMRPLTGQAFYGIQRTVPEMYREQPVYNVPPPSIQQPKVGGYSEAIGMVRPPPPAAAAVGGVGVAEPGYSTVTYDGGVRQVYYTTQGGVVQPYQAVSAVAAPSVDGRQGGGGGGAWNPEGGKVVASASQTPPV